MVRSIKKREIPSTPKEKFKFEAGNHAKSQTNWKREYELSKNNHRKREITKTKKEEKTAVFFIAVAFLEGKNNIKRELKKSIPNIRGITKLISNDLNIENLLFIMETSRFELETPCLQSKYSTYWAMPPEEHFSHLRKKIKKQKK